MARYGKKAQQKVKRAMHERKKGKLKSGRSGKKSYQPKAGDRHRALRGSACGGKGAVAQRQEEKEIVRPKARCVRLGASIN
jgi:hypothetical protein